MIKKYLLTAILLMLIAPLFTFQIALAELQDQKDISAQSITQTSDKQTNTIIYVFDNDTSALRLNGNDYWSIKKGGVIKTDSNNTLIEANFTVNENGGKYVFGNEKVNIPPNSKVFFKDGKLIIDAPENSEITNLSTKITNPNNNLKDNVIQLNGKNLKLPNGAILQDGTLNYEGGMFYAKDRVVISGLEIYPSKTSYDSRGIRLFFDSDIPTDYSGIKIDTKNKEIVVEYPSFESLLIKNLADTRTRLGPPFNINFLEDNPFLDVEKGDKFQISSYDIFRAPNDKLSLSIINQDENGKIPKILIEGQCQISDDGSSIDTQLEKYLGDSRDKMSSAASLISSGLSGSNLGGFGSVPIEIFTKNGEKINDEKIIVDNFKEFAVIGSNLDEFSKENYQGSIVPKMISNSITYNYPSKERIEEEYNVQLDINNVPLADQPGVLRKLDDFLSNTPQDLVDPTSSIIVRKGNMEDLSPLEKLESTLSEDPLTLASASMGIATMGGQDFTISSLRHELAHNKDFADIPELKSAYEEAVSLNNQAKALIDKMNSLTDEEKKSFKIEDYPELNSITSKFEEAKKNLLSALNKSTVFRQEWIGASGGLGVYGQGVTKSLTWDSDKTVSPKNGFIRPYGATKFQEDIATYQENILNPSFFKPLIDSTSPQYDPKYKQKLDLLLKYKYITQAEYNSIFK